MRGTLELQKEVNKGSLHLIINVAAATCSHRVGTGSCIILGLRTSTPSHNKSLLLLQEARVSSIGCRADNDGPNHCRPFTLSNHPYYCKDPSPGQQYEGYCACLISYTNGSGPWQIALAHLTQGHKFIVDFENQWPCSQKSAQSSLHQGLLLRARA